MLILIQSDVGFFHYSVSPHFNFVYQIIDQLNNCFQCMQMSSLRFWLPEWGWHRALEALSTVLARTLAVCSTLASPGPQCFSFLLTVWGLPCSSPFTYTAWFASSPSVQTQTLTLSSSEAPLKSWLLCETFPGKSNFTTLSCLVQLLNGKNHWNP